MLYSAGKDSSVLQHLARKAFYPSRPPFPLLHIDTTWKFRDMYLMRERMRTELGWEVIVHTNAEAVAAGIDPFRCSSAVYTDLMKTQALKQALDRHGFDVAFGGARRDEEASRAKERIFSFRREHVWDPRRQRPELWQLYNTRIGRGESMRVFPLSNWTELDVWRYIDEEQVPVAPLYFAAERPTVLRDGALLMLDDDRMPVRPGEDAVPRRIRFRTLGCYPLTSATLSEAATVADIVRELESANLSERHGRLIDHDQPGSMETKKREGYF